MIETATAVKADRGDALLDGALADELADEGSGLLVGAQLAGGTELGVEGRGRADGLAIDVVDDLSINVGVGVWTARRGRSAVPVTLPRTRRLRRSRPAFLA